ncbi:Bug family tripartite tricarboxylate transporter substrate binding protein [Falsiroseomonas stagni]|jgi:tripartite-type tricarboxylate transporter receptor subunit TctC|uniref:Tripartite-type tricarboxylate transporter, receptor component TctC n=1 Tax=Falsiroseomonas stagni DSM 19981 TaxID=1123062 RepID=A0A1I4CVR1_9PROT|nr:tripartite tricarboxylate transporter substrate binding protein [Falsiroseomonas stagni]SFK84883.1 Tripartite-type tricarboxylate transporter, receptor component TctC [Falsiroseomonas stagni DSM 19981]
MTVINIGRRGALASAMALLAYPAAAQASFPTRAIRLIVPNPAGGSGDTITRIIGDRLGVELGGQVVVDNRPGAATTIGTTAVARAEPDGYTLLSLPSSGLVQTVLRARLPYDLTRDFAPVLGIGSIPLVLVAAASSTIRTLDDLRRAARSGDGISYGSGGAGTIGHISGARLLGELGGRGTHVPFRGNAEVLQAMAGGHVQIMFASVAEVPPLVAAGHLRALGVTAAAREPSLPETPTMRELGFADFEPSTWYAFMAPARTPQPVLSRLSAGFTAALADPTVQAKLRELSFTTEIRNPEQLAAFLREEAHAWGKVVRENNLTASD